MTTPTELNTALNVMLLIENGCAEAAAKRFVKQFEDKCAEVKRLNEDLESRMQAWLRLRRLLDGGLVKALEPFAAKIKWLSRQHLSGHADDDDLIPVRIGDLRAADDALSAATEGR